MYWAVGTPDLVGAVFSFPSYPSAIRALERSRRKEPRYDWRLYSLSDVTPPTDPLTRAYAEEG